MARPKGEERRRTERVPIKIPVDYSSVDDFFSEFSTNINNGGIFVETDTPEETDTVVTLQFKLPGLDEPVAVIGRVAWTSDGKGENPAGMGVEFHGLDDRIRSTIDEIVRRLRAD
jgi:uncharacterized protein (TIGR02266 family)